MKKILLISFLSISLFAGNFIFGFGYGSIKSKAKTSTTDYSTGNVRDINYKIGWEVPNHSRVLITNNTPNMEQGEKLSLNTISWQAIDQTDPSIKGFIGVSVGQLKYSNPTIDYTATPYGIEIGFVLLESEYGNWVKNHLEMEFGYRYFTKMAKKNNFEIKDFINSYVGFNFVF